MNILHAAALVLACWSVPACAQDSALMAADIAAHTPMMENLEELCDGIGPRLTGSQQLRAAQAWAMARLTQYGATNVHLEAYDLGRPWHRGTVRARLLNANRMTLDVVQKAWTDGTHGEITADVALLDVKTLDQFKAALPALKGKLVLVGSGPVASPAQQQDLPRFRADVDQAIDAAQLAGVLLISTKEGTLRDMWGGPASRFKRNAGIVTREHANMLQRLLARGVVPRVALTLDGGFGKRPIKAYNVVADLPGTDPHGAMVIVGAHLDSWDLGSGATDNASGTVMALEVLRALHASGLRPQHTLRVILFSGEEQGLLGSRAYVAAHRAELPAIQAVLVQDTGAGRITGFPDMKVDAWFAALSAAVLPAKALGPIDIVYAVGKGSDHDPFFEAGIPAFAPMQELRDYRSVTQHTQADTLEHIDKANLVQAAQVMAITAWGLLNAPRLPHVTPD
jgi:hypothetical protein